ncbi:hypothetical protein XF24_00589 [candidate division SR1 bacterium Aalborg_AAW-1]|nr:hypothetical protein XF24_00589 [candidate division SR1 bacterium Aalborg_AAW-1]
MNILFITMTMLSCRHNDDVTQNDIYVTESFSVASKVSVSGATSTYEVKPEITQHVLHFNDVQAGATAYMIASSALAKYYHNNDSYPYGPNSNKLAEITYHVGANPTINNLYNYAVNYDNSFLLANKLITLSKIEMINFVKNSLTMDRPVIVNNTVLVSTVNSESLYSNLSSTNGDLSPSGNMNMGIKPNYISTLNENNNTIKTNFIVIIKFVQTTADGNGVVHYIDPLASAHTPSDVKYVSMFRLLDSMKWSQTDNDYSALALASR